MAERAGDGVLVSPPHAIGIWPGCVSQGGSQHRDQAGRALCLRSSLGESARVKCGRFLVRSQDGARRVSGETRCDLSRDTGRFQLRSLLPGQGDREVRRFFWKPERDHVLLAQWIERRTTDAEVRGSSPRWNAKMIRPYHLTGIGVSVVKSTLTPSSPC